MSKENISSEMADYFGVDHSIRAFIPDLLADLFDLGGFPEMIVDLMRPLGLSRGKAKILDLGCGKGAVSIAIAKELGFEVYGIDLMRPFIDEAKHRAEEDGLSSLCHFECGNMAWATDQKESFDAVLLISVGYVLGGIEETIEKLRGTVKQKGYMVIDDVFLKPGASVDFPGYEHCLPREETISRITRHGDRVVEEFTIPLDATKAQNKRYMDWIEARVNKLASTHPEYAEAFHRYAEKEQTEIEIIENKLVNVTWVLQKN
jgi:cyclopropane fatty-acyl-phospholipid synthase-like methyltransferase